MEGTMDCGARSEEVRPAQKNAIYAPLCRSYLVGQNEQTGRKQLLREAVDGQWVFVGNGTNAHAEQNGGLSLGVLLKHDPAQHCAIERTKMTASSKVRMRRLDAHPRATGSLRRDGALPTCMDAYR